MPDRPNSTDSTIDAILEHIMAIFPVLHRRILRMDLGGSVGDITRLHLGVMGRLSLGNVPLSELARTSLVHKPQMTRIIDQLERSGFVERIADPSDRRVTNIALTASGRVMLANLKLKVTENVKKALATLSPEELVQMSEALETLERIIGKL